MLRALKKKNKHKKKTGFRKVIVLFTAIVIFFFFYNIFLVDNTLETLRFSLDQTALAYDMNDLDGIDLLLDRLIAEEILPGNMNLINVANLEYVRNSIRQGKSYKAIDSMNVSLSNVIKEKEKKRGPLFSTLDEINRFFRNTGAYLANLPGKLFKHRKAEKAPQVRMKLYDQAKEMEKTGKMEEAISLYDEFMKTYPSYDKMGLVKLRVANIYQRSNQYDKASELYREVIKSYPGGKESYIAKLFLSRLHEADKLQLKANALLSDVSELNKNDIKKMQEAFYKLGNISLELLNMDEAKKFFKRAALTDPNSDISLKSRFNSAWVSKEKNDLDESISEFSSIAEENPKAALALDSRYQMADIYRKEGRYEESINIYVKLAAEYKDDPIAQLCLFQAGASCMYDLNDDERAKELFGTLTKKYPRSPYSKYLAPENPIGLFVTYLVPRATRVVAFRISGLLALSGYSGEISKFKVRIYESEFTRAFNDWLKAELPDTVGNMYVEIMGAEINMQKDKAKTRARITMGKISIDGESEWRLELTKEGSINLVVTKVIIDKIPVPPVLINNALTGLSLIIKKNFPVIFTSVSMKTGEIDIEGYSSKRLMQIVETSSGKVSGSKIEIEDFEDKREAASIYRSFDTKFPESNFSALPRESTEDLFLDFFTRMYLYFGYKLMETVKDSRLNIEQGIRTLGMLLVKKERFRVSYKDTDINTSLNRLIQTQFPLIINEEFVFDLKGLDLKFTDEGVIRFEGTLGVGHVYSPVIDLEAEKKIDIRGSVSMDINTKSNIPNMVFNEVFINDIPFPVKKLNLVASRCLDILEDGRFPFQLEEANISNSNITLRGQGAKDLTTSLFSDPYLFVIFKIREEDMPVANICTLRKYQGYSGDNRLGWQGTVKGLIKTTENAGQVK